MEQTTYPCPACGHLLWLDPNAETEIPVFCPNPGGMPTLEIRPKHVAVAFCTRCDYVHEIDFKAHKKAA